MARSKSTLTATVTPINANVAHLNTLIEEGSPFETIENVRGVLSFLQGTTASLNGSGSGPDIDRAWCGFIHIMQMADDALEAAERMVTNHG